MSDSDGNEMDVDNTPSQSKKARKKTKKKVPKLDKSRFSSNFKIVFGMVRYDLLVIKF